MLSSYTYLDVRIRDMSFLAYQPGLILAWGVGGLIVMVWCLVHSRPWQGKFWVGLVLCTYFGGVLLTTEGYDLGGIAHVIAQPITWIGMAWIVSRISEMPRWLVRTWRAGVFIDMCWLMLHFVLESHWIQFRHYANGYSPIDMSQSRFAHTTLT